MDYASFFLPGYIRFTSWRARCRKLTPASRRQGAPSVQAGGELKKDPVCGTYVSTASSLTRTVNGQVIHFCSKACSDRYPKA